jgi:Rv0078B-related antitoxin
MTTAQRLKLALEMSESLRNITRAGLRSRHPELSADELSRELLRIMYGFSSQP